MSDTRVKIDLSFTRNLGNYESIKIGIGIEDIVRSGETVNAATESISLSKLMSGTGSRNPLWIWNSLYFLDLASFILSSVM